MATQPTALPFPGPTPIGRARGCLIGGAVGDALGAPVEFLSIAQIRQQAGDEGVTGFADAFWGRGSITDDTQMSFFTAEGLIRAVVRARAGGAPAFPSAVRNAYLRWLHTQGAAWEEIAEGEGPDGWLIDQDWLHSERSPATSCLSALREPIGERYKPRNGNRDCGCLARVAPAGLLPRAFGEPFDLGCDLAAITHGHPDAFLSAGFLAMLIAELNHGAELEQALETTAPYLERWPECGEVSEVVRYARKLARSKDAMPENIERIGEGWDAEEALAIAIFCALRAADFRQGVLSAVNHGGDSDSIGAVTGSILGTLGGVGSIPKEWVDEVEGRETAEQLAGDLLAIASGEGEVNEAERQRYPAS